MEAKAHILILDDDSDLRTTLSMILENEGYRPLAVADGKEALDAIQSHEPVVALIDLKLGDMSGLDVLREIKGRYPAIECIVVTGHASQSSAVEAVNLGAYGYVVKPYAVDQLLVAIRRAVEKREAQDALRRSEREKALILSTVSEFVCYQDCHHRIIWANRAAAESVDARPEELVGRFCYEVWRQRSEPCDACPVADALETGQPQEVDMTAAGGRAWHIRGYPVRTESGVVTGVVEIAQDITARKRAEEALRFTQFSVDHAADAAFWMGPDARFMYVNDAACRSLGYTRDQLLSMSVHDIDPSFPAERWPDHWRELKACGSLVFESTHRASNGRIFAVEITANYLEFGGREYNCAFARDITERKRAEETLRASEKRFQDLFDEAPVGYHELDTEGNIIRVNRTELSVLGYTAEEMLGRPVWEFVVESDASRKTLQAKIVGTVPPERAFERTYRRKDGTILPVLIEDRLLYDADGGIAGVRSTIQDITERKRAEEEQEKFVSLVENSSDFVGMATLDGNVFYVNEAGRRLVGLDSLEEALSTTIFEYAPGGQTSRLRTEIMPTLMETGRWEGEGQLRHLKTGQLIDVEISTFLVRHPRSGKPICVATIQSDITARKRAEEALRQSEARYRDLVDHSQDAVWRIDRQGRFTFVSPAAKAMLGYEPGELIGQPFERILTETSTQKAWESLGQRLAGKLGDEALTFELTIQRNDGTEFVGETRSVPIYDRSGKTVEIEGVTRDITQRKRAEEALRAMGESERRFREQLANLLDVTNVLTAAESLDDLCRQAVELGRDRLGFDRLGIWFYGAGGESIVGSFGTDESGQIRDERAVRIPIGPDSLYSKIYTQRIAVSFEPDVPLRDEKTHVVGRGWHAVTALWDGGQVIGCLNADNLVGQRPISDDQLEILNLYGSTLGHLCTRKRAEEALRESEEMYKTLVSTSPDAVTMTDLEGTLTYVSQQTVELHGFDSTHEMIGMSALDLIMPEDRERARTNLRKTLQTGHARNVAYTLRKKDGTSFTGEISASLIKDVHGNPKAFIGTTRDTTDRRRLEEQLRQAQKMEAVGRLAGGIAHDFNNLLTAIGGHAEWSARTPNLDEPILRRLEEIQDATKRASTLTRQLLAFSRRQTLKPQVIDLNDVLVDTDKMLRSLIGEDIQLVTRPAKNLWAVRVDPGQLEQVIVNLAVNARDAMPEGGKLILETANACLDATYASRHPGCTPGDYVMLAVTDTGSGISDEVKAHLFEPFFTTKDAGKGTGLGLATCYGIIKQSGGYISVYSEPEHGTTFKIYLPRVVEEPSELPRLDPASELPRGNETILLVEDEPSVRSLARDILAELGYRVVDAANGVEALDKTRQLGGAAIHLLLTDVVMPEMGGKALCERLRAQQPDLKVLFTSGYPDNGILDGEKIALAGPLLQKPFTPSSLALKVRELLDS